MRHVDAPMLFRGLSAGQFPRILELGCGTGVGTAEILRHLQPRELVATDLDPDMLRDATRRLREAHLAQRVTFEQVDATRLPYADGTFDAVVAFAILHHIPEYRAALGEIARVLKPDGVLLLEEVTRDIHFWPVNKLMVPAVLLTDTGLLDVLEQYGFEATWKGRYGKAYLFLECAKRSGDPPSCPFAAAEGGYAA
jgi:ubiquinone/menaquinone biosynthesis C-methylase UbiE